MNEKTCRNCAYYKPDYGIFCVNGWSRDGSTGYCYWEPKRLAVEGRRPGCGHWDEKYDEGYKEGVGK